MPRIKHLTNRYLVSLNKIQNEALLKLMVEDMQTNVSAYFGQLIVEVTKTRQLVKDKTKGRPRNEKPEEEEEPEIYPHPFQNPEMSPVMKLTKTDWEGTFTFRNMPVPDINTWDHSKFHNLF